MARKSPSRLELRRQAEAVEGREEGEEAAPKKATRAKSATPRTRKVKEKVVARKRLVWVIFNGSMKEEGKFPYDQLAAAEEKLEALRQKSKKMYFLQPVKELLGDGSAVIAVVPNVPDDEVEEEAAMADEEAAEEEEEAAEEEAEEEDEEEEFDDE